MRRRLLAATLAVPLVLAAPRAVLAGADPGPVDPTAPQVPLNFTASAYARGLDRPGALLVLPNADVLVATHAGVTLLRGGAEGPADAEFPLITDLGPPLGLALRRDKLYVATAEALHACTYMVGRQRIGGRCHPIATWPDGAGAPVRGGLAFNRDETVLYVLLGGGAEPAALWAVQPDGKAMHAAAPQGATALAVEPARGAVWVAQSGLRLAAPLDAAAAARALDPAGTVTGLAFYARDRYPKEFRGGLFVAEGGAGDAAAARISHVAFAAGQPVSAPVPFVTGFQHGRPDAIAVSRDGALLVADEARGTVWRIAFRCGACTPDPVLPARRH